MESFVTRLKALAKQLGDFDTKTLADSMQDQGDVFDATLHGLLALIASIPDQPEQYLQTGPLQFGNNWPGVFLQGDMALMGARTIHMALGKNGPEILPILSMELTALMHTLQSCAAIGKDPERLRHAILLPKVEK